jgi:Pregnancy-associated plasma protein-A/Secretion system C-terminal sorting domain
MPKAYLLVCLLLRPGLLLAQPTHQAEQRCATFGEARLREMQAHLHRYQLAQPVATPQFRVENPSYRLPLVFHIVHYGEPLGQGTNVPASQVYSQIEVLNEDFQQRNPDFANTLPQFRQEAGQMDIEFYPTRDDPSGQRLAEPGIHRIQIPRPAPGFFWTAETFDAQVKPRTIWDPSRYLNVWVVDSLQLDGRVGAGYAQFPDLSGLAGLPELSPAQTDGVVVRYVRLGSLSKVPSNAQLRSPLAGLRFVYGRTLTHEIGHFLGLLHPYQGGSCGVDGDFCPDTPPTTSSSLQCNLNQAPCGVPMMVQNYMQLTDDACMSLFTACQVQRMVTVLAVAPRRRSLLTSNVGDGGPVTGPANPLLARQVQLYPNPARQQVRVQLPTAAQKVQIYSSLGQLVRQWAATGTQLELDLTGLPAGWYWVHLQTAAGPVVKPLVVE